MKRTANECCSSLYLSITTESTNSHLKNHPQITDLHRYKAKVSVDKYGRIFFRAIFSFNSYLLTSLMVKNVLGVFMLKIAVLGSGSGSNYQSIQDNIDAGTLDAVVCCVLSDVKDAKILTRARIRSIPAHFVDCAPFKTKLDGEAEQKLIDLLQSYEIDVIVLAGFMRMIKPGLLRAFPLRIINIHPSLLPAFPGLQSWTQALEYGVKWTGCTVHFVDEGMDTGAIIVQKSVPVLDTDTSSTLHARIQEQEYLAYPEALTLLAKGSLCVDGRCVRSRDGNG